jgi:hypothetical protein
MFGFGKMGLFGSKEMISEGLFGKRYISWFVKFVIIYLVLSVFVIWNSGTGIQMLIIYELIQIAVLFFLLFFVLKLLHHFEK